MSSSRTRSNSVPLAGATTSGNIYVHVAPAEGIREVRFHVDDPARARQPYRVERRAPLDLAGTRSIDGTAEPFNTRSLSDGSHTVTAAIDTLAGTTSVVHGQFTVRNNPPAAACSDGADNDRDGRTDFPADPGCVGASDTDETDPPPASNPGGDTLYFNGGFESGAFSPWYLQCMSSRFAVRSAQPAPFKGAYSARYEVRDGDVEPNTGAERCEVSGFRFDHPADYWIRYAIYVPPETQLQNMSWLAVFQYKESSDYGSPPMEMFLDRTTSGAGRFRLASGDSRVTVWTGPEIQRGRWYDFTTHVSFNSDPTKGFAELWVDGVPQALANGQSRRYLATAKAGTRGYLKAGVYRDPAHTATTVVYNDNILVGNSYAAVHP